MGDPRPCVFRFGACVLDLDRGTLERAGSLVPIRAKAFGLLCHLARNAGRVVSKDELLDRVWAGVTVTEDSLTQAIRDLRRAIGDDGQTLVRTIARRGYLFALPLDPPEPAAGPGVAQPRVAVLPFRNLTGDPDQGVLLDGLVEEITNGLARFKTVTVIARHSAFAFRPENPASPEDVAARLGADYLVEGSARSQPGGLLISAALSEARERPAGLGRELRRQPAPISCRSSRSSRAGSSRGSSATSRTRCSPARRPRPPPACRPSSTSPAPSRSCAASATA